MMNSFQGYLKKGCLKKQNPNFAQIAKQLRRAYKDLKTAERTLGYDPEWTATIAYQAMLRGGRSLLFAHGFLPADGAQHRTVVELTGKILGDECANLIRQFNKFRKKRNLFFYDSEDTGNIDEAKKALEISKELLDKIKIFIEKLSPQVHFEF